MPRYYQDAVNTSIGRAHPISGYQLDANKDLSPVAAYYKPNCGLLSFVDPEAEVTPDGLILFQRDGFGSLGVALALHSQLEDITSVAWTFGDSATETSGQITRHVYSAAGSYTVSAEMTSTSKGTKSYSVTITVEDASGMIVDDGNNNVSVDNTGGA